ncbi:acyl-CoA dehydrogenase [Rhodoligotrophos appendicifer]|uniref:acyl-CoA dehydrogenase family protein n=1 Tax=Rhodoligotrophos appendicifer TaxID=987056 RepID=UPI0011860F4C|nr:acyl-CoA dehydrogenase family protein [Rhodoligotrophos appendicifer]
MSGWQLWTLPFFEAHHQKLAERVASWRAPSHDEPRAEELADACRALALSLAEKDILEILVPRRDAQGGRKIDVRALCIAREAVAYESGLADAVLAMQGIGTAALWMHGSEEQQALVLDRARSGEAITGFALTEPGSGSDVANITTRAEASGGDYVINGEKAFISNGGFADHYVVVARTGEAPGARGLSAFLVDKDAPGLSYGPPMELMAAHPLSSLTFSDCRVPASRLIGEAGRGFKIAMETFDIFRTSVGAATLGMARRAMDETLARVKERHLFGSPMADIAGVQMKLADMSIDLELAALSVYRAAWAKDTIGGRCTREASMAKYVGTEAASRVIDGAVQIFGGLGVTRGSIVEQLYREVRASRIYEGASEVQKLVIGRSLLSERP